MKKRIYVDYAATTPIKQQVLDEMHPYLTAEFANPSGAYSIAAESRMAIDSAREKVACAVNADRNEIYFTSGGSESDNWAILGTALANSGKGRHIVTTKIEHHAVLHSCQYLEKMPNITRAFIVTDPVSGSTTPRGKLIFGLSAGAIAYAIRVFGGYPDGVAFAVLLLNICVPLIDLCTQPPIFGMKGKS